MSVGNDLQEMEVGTVQSKTAVNSVEGGDPMVLPFPPVLFQLSNRRSRRTYSRKLSS